MSSLVKTGKYLSDTATKYAMSSLRRQGLALIFLAAFCVSCNADSDRSSGNADPVGNYWIHMPDIFSSAAAAMSEELGTQLKTSAPNGGLCLSLRDPDCGGQSEGKVVRSTMKAPYVGRRYYRYQRVKS